MAGNSEKAKKNLEKAREKIRSVGRPKASHTILAEKTKQLLIEMVFKEKEPIFRALIDEAKNGDVMAIKEIFDRVFGKAVQAVAVSGALSITPSEETREIVERVISDYLNDREED